MCVFFFFFKYNYFHYWNDNVLSRHVISRSSRRYFTFSFFFSFCFLSPKICYSFFDHFTCGAQNTRALYKCLDNRSIISPCFLISLLFPLYLFNVSERVYLQSLSLRFLFFSLLSLLLFTFFFFFRSLLYFAAASVKYSLLGLRYDFPSFRWSFMRPPRSVLSARTSAFNPILQIP